MIDQYNALIGFAVSLLTIASILASGVRYLGREGAVQWTADRLGVDLLEYTLPDDREEREEFLGERFEPEVLLRAAGQSNPPTLLVEEAIHQSDEHPVDLLGGYFDQEGVFALAGAQLTDEQVSQLSGDRGVLPDPISEVIHLPDDPGTCYAWLLDDDASEADREALINAFEQGFIQERHREPEALHLILRDVDEIRQLDEHTLKSHVRPWINRKDEHDKEEDN